MILRCALNAVWCCDADYMNSKYACVCGISYVNMSRFLHFRKTIFFDKSLNNQFSSAMAPKAYHSASQKPKPIYTENSLSFHETISINQFSMPNMLFFFLL